MADTKGIIELLLSDEKLMNSKSFRSAAYSDEPIIKPASKMTNYTPPEIIRLQKMSRVYAAYSPVEVEFYKQAKEMESYEDDFEYDGLFNCYYPTYRNMTINQMRGYFSWRTKVRKGIYEETSLSFLFVYIYELLHLVGASSAEDGFEKLITFYENYRDYNPEIKRYMKIWLSDFAVYHNLDKSYLERVDSVSFDSSLIVLQNYEGRSDDELFNAITELSSHRIENSKFYKCYPEDMKAVICNVYKAMSEYYAKHRKKTFCESLFGQKISNTYTMFSAAVFCDYKRYRDYEYVVSDIHKYSCKNGRWSCEKYYGNRGKNHMLGDILRTIDSVMRVKYNFGHNTNPALDTKLILSIISKEIDRYLELKKKNEAPEIKIDVSKLQGIRTAAEITRDKLIVDEENDNFDFADDYGHDTVKTEVSAENNTSLDTAEYEFMQCLLYGGDWHAAVKKHGKMLSILADSVNEKLFDIFGDTVIVFDGDVPELIEDYTDELKGYIKR